MFNVEKFNQAEIQFRKKKIEVPALADFFDGAPLWEIRGLSGEEVARVNEASEKNRNLNALLTAFSSAASTGKGEALKSALAIGDDLPDDLARRIEILIYGSVAPQCNRDLAIKLCSFYPTIFYDLTNEILILSGEGGDIAGKQ